MKPLCFPAVLTHHWLVRIRGGEKVLLALRELLPESPIYTLLRDPALRLPEICPGAGCPRIVTSWLQKVPGACRHYPRLLALLPLAARTVRLPAVELVVCSDAAIAKAMRVHPRSKLVCYCHSPPRYAWEPAIRRSYEQSLPMALRPLFRAAAEMVRRADAKAARRVDLFVANSRHVADRIRRFYGRHSVVVYPPVELPDRPAQAKRQDFYLCVGYHVPYKRLDLAVAACEMLKRRLVVIGDGPQADALRRHRPANVEWLGWQERPVIEQYYQRARGLLFAGEEDFGIVPVEAMAHGCPVIAWNCGGVRETVEDGLTGVLFDRQDAQSLAAAIRRAESLRFDPVLMHARMQRFSRQRFLRQMSALLTEVLQERKVSMPTAGVPDPA
jgi:glycosyltransferase involved in cell wall biosynthesis